MMSDIKLIHGDCLEVMDKLISQGIKVDMVLTDIPYGTTNCKWDSIIPFNEMWKRLNCIKKENTPILLFGSEPFSSVLRMSNIKEYKYDWKWNKLNGGNPLIAKYRPLGIIEDIMVFGKGKINYYPIMEQAKDENKRPRDKSYKKTTDLLAGIKSGEFKAKDTHDENLRYPKNELIFDSRKGELNNLHRLHPTQKPTELLEYLINTYTYEGCTILDFTMGSGSTGISCLNTNRNFIGIELDNTYFKVATDRIDKYIKDNNIQSNLEIQDTICSV